ncbi:MAG: protease pro-enzyme activation domain-containing protein [Solirubrobacteraceae bacterium]
MSSQSRLVTLVCTCAAIVGACRPAAANMAARSAGRSSGHGSVELAHSTPHHHRLHLHLHLHRGQHGRSVVRTPPISVAISLRERHAGRLTAFIRELDTPGSPELRHPLRPAQFRARFSPTAAQANGVVRFLRRLGFRQVALTRNRLFVTARASTSQAKRAFRVRLASYRDGGRSVYANATAPTVPARIVGRVRAVLGLNDFPDFVRPTQATEFTASAPPDFSLAPLGSTPRPYGSCYYTPSAFRTAYDAGALTGAGIPIAIMAEGHPSQTVRDLRTAEAAFGEPAVPTTIERVGRPGTDLNGTDEWDLDTQFCDRDGARDLTALPLRGPEAG